MAKRLKASGVTSLVDATPVRQPNGGQSSSDDSGDTPADASLEACSAVVAVSAEELAAESEFVISLGGDGTLLYAAGLLCESVVPVLGVHMGTLGFLTQFQEAEVDAAVDAALEGELVREERMRLQTVIRRQGKPPVTGTAANDVVLSQGKMARLLELDVYMDGSFMTSYRADGLILGTPTGSTAYNLAAGGPIINPGVDALVLTPICPHSLTQRPTVLPSTGKLSVVVGDSGQGAFVTIDGQSGEILSPGDHVEVSRSRHPLVLFRSPKRSFFDILRTKLMWGEGALKSLPRSSGEGTS